MTFTVSPLKFSHTDRRLAVDRTLRTTGRDGSAAMAEMIREVEEGRGFLLGGVRGCGKTSLLNEVSAYFNRQAGNVVALGPLSLGLVAQNGLDSLGSQLSDWFRENVTRFPYTLPSSYQPTRADSLDAWLPFLDRLISERNADTLLVLLDDLDSVPLEDRETILQEIHDSSWAKIAKWTVLGCAENLPEDEVSLITGDETYDSDRAGSEDFVTVIISRRCALALYQWLSSFYQCLPDLYQALTVALGSPGSLMKSEKKGGGGGKKYGAKQYHYPGGKPPAGGKPPRGGRVPVGKPPRGGRVPVGKPPRGGKVPVGKPPGGGKPEGGGKPRAEAAIREEVEATVYAPQQASPGNSFLVQVYAALPEQAPALEEIAKKAEPEAEMRAGTTLPEKIQRGDKLTFKLDMPGLKIDKPEKSCIWRGKRELVQFNVMVPKNSQPGKIIGTVEMWGNSVPIGDLMFSFEIITETAAVVPETQPVGKMKQYKRVFVSYSRRDGAEVEKRTQTWNSLDLNYFMDRKTLKSGDEWEKLIYQNIDQSDAFYLFWSKAASESDWVKKEFMYALNRQAGNRQAPPKIYPMTIEGPPAFPKPPELEHLQFEDCFPDDQPEKGR